MEVPSPADGVVQKITVAEGDVVSQGSLIMVMDAAASQDSAAPQAAAEPAQVKTDAAPATAPIASADPATTLANVNEAEFAKAHASPSVRAFARQLGVDLSQIKGSGRRGRIIREDVTTQFKGAAGAAASPAGKLEVTHQESADITDLDKYRKEMDTQAKADGYRVTLLSFIIKASVSALKAHWEFNSSIHPDGDKLIKKSYYNIGFAADTPHGLMVPVIKDADRKGIIEISRELADLSGQAREGKLKSQDMQGATFTISSLGGIGGTSFTPIVNAPEVAILGLTRSKLEPVWDGEQFVPRNMLPMSLSYDHRAVDGALAARFAATLKHLLGDVRRLMH